MEVTFLLIVSLAIVLLGILWGTRKHWRIHCVLGAIVLSALMTWCMVMAHKEEQKQYDELMNSINDSITKLERMIQELQKRELAEGKQNNE